MPDDTALPADVSMLIMAGPTDQNIHAIPGIDPGGDNWVFDTTNLDLSGDLAGTWGLSIGN